MIFFLASDVQPHISLGIHRYLVLEQEVVVEPCPSESQRFAELVGDDDLLVLFNRFIRPGDGAAEYVAAIQHERLRPGP